MTGSRSRLSFLPLPQDDPVQRQPDISLAREILDGWSPKVDLEKGLEHTIAYFTDLLNP
jgi:UDP-glucuronate decarboxylase